jgi:hypothetical protein
MKRMIVPLSLVLAIGLLAGCGGGQTAAPSGGEQAAAPSGVESGEVEATAPSGGNAGEPPPGFEAFWQINQLAMGTLYLQGTEDAVTPEQAEVLLPLWQALQSLQAGGAADQAEVDELLAQIEAAMTPEQMDALTNLSQEDLQNWAQSQGMGFGPGGGPGPGPGGTQGERPTPPSPEEIETLQAERGGGEPGTPGGPGGPGGFGAPGGAMLDAVIDMLESLTTS